MADYTYSQLSQMQKEAAERVTEMRRRARFAAEDAAKQFEARQTGHKPSAQPHDCDKPPSNNNPHPCCKRQVCKKEQTATKCAAKGLTEDADRALLLSLCFLLQAEKADEELILAMLYILT